MEEFVRIFAVAFLTLWMLFNLILLVRKVTGCQFIRGLRYVYDGPNMIQKAYEQASGGRFTVATPTNNHILLSSPQLIEEAFYSSHPQLSLHAVAKEYQMLQPKYTMRGFEWQDKRGLEGTGFVRALRSLLTAHLPEMIPHLRGIIEQGLQTEFQLYKKPDGSSHIPISRTVKNLISKANCFVFFGEKIAQDHKFVHAALTFPRDVMIAAELLRLVPTVCAPLVARLATGNHKASRYMFKVLAPIVQQRLLLRSTEQQKTKDAPVDCMQWLIDTSPRNNPWTVERMVGEIMAIWFGSVHQLAIASTFALEDLCLFPEYVGPLRDEASQASVSVNDLPLLDSFLKESARLSSVDAISCRRKALTPFTFSDGFAVAVGDWLCIPQKAMLHDPQFYSDPEIFDGFRFVTQRSDSDTTMNHENKGCFTETSVDWPMWGLGKIACPGRFYAACMMKIIMVEVLKTYDCALLDKKGSRAASWRSSVIPYGNTIIVFRKRQENGVEVA